MEKMCWLAIALLWSGMIGSAAMGAIPTAGRSLGADGPDSRRADRQGVVTNVPNSQILSMSSQALPLATPVSSVTASVLRRPVVVIGQAGSGEVLAAFAVGGVALWSARRRRIV